MPDLSGNSNLPPTRRSTTVYLVLAASVVILGFSAIFVRVSHAPGTVSAFYRMSIASLLVVLPFSIRVRARETTRRRRLDRRGVGLAVLGGTFFGLDLALWSTGIVMSGATNPTLMANTAPLWVGLGSVLIFHERQRRMFWIGLALATAGAVLVLGQDLSKAARFGLGTLLGLLAAVFYGAYYLVTQRGRASLDTLSYFWITTTSSAGVLLVIILLSGARLTGYDATTWLTFLALGLVVQVAGWMMINFAQGYLPASIISPTLLGQPVMTALIAALLLGERFTPWHLLGGAAVLAGVYLVHRSRWVGERKAQVLKETP